MNKKCKNDDCVLRTRISRRTLQSNCYTYGKDTLELGCIKLVSIHGFLKHESVWVTVHGCSLFP